MTSESSSAVLDLDNVGAEDTDPPSMTEDTKDIVPLIMEHGYDIAVKVDAPMKQLSTLETFVTYRVRCVCARWPTPPYVRRRYNHFKLLHKRLAQAHPLIAAPPLPPLHSARQQLDRYSPSFVAIRTLALDAFLDRVAKHPILTYSEDFRTFLTTPDEELDKVFRSENSALNLWGLSAAFYGSGEAKPSNGSRVKDPEFTSAADYLQSLQQKLTTLCTLTTKLYKGTASLSNELMGMKRACDLWSCQERASVSRAGGACACGANAAHRAALMAARAPPVHRATLPMLAAYAGAHVEKINSRDAVHATYVSGTNTTSEVHNRLEQASEALRSELADWLPKTHGDIKSLLLDLATRQVNLQTQILMGWEHALKLSTDASVDEMFKTVSKSAVQNLSPSKCRSPNETERDFDDFEDVSNDSDSRDAFVSDDGNAEFETELANVSRVAANENEENITDRNIGVDSGVSVNHLDLKVDGVSDSRRVDGVTADSRVDKLAEFGNVSNITDRSNKGVGNESKVNCDLEVDEVSESCRVDEVIAGSRVDDAEFGNTKRLPSNSKVNCADSAVEINTEVNAESSILNSELKVPDSVKTESDDAETVSANNDEKMTKSDEFLNEILNDRSDNHDKVRNDFKDPLTEFSDVDLS